jgi:hypothetical protein
MGEPWETIVRVVIIIGIAGAIWHFNSSMERIADALTRMADRENPRPGKHDGDA